MAGIREDLLDERIEKLLGSLENPSLNDTEIERIKKKIEILEARRQ